MHFELRNLNRAERHRLMSGVVVPRPIAFVTTVNLAGRVNAAPYSWFNCAGMDPPLVMFAPQNRFTPGELPKDTVMNIRETGEFVVNMVTEDIAKQMNICSMEFPPEVDELSVAGLTTVPSIDVRPPRIAESPVHLECKEAMTVEIRRSRFVIGEVVRVHVPDGMVDSDTYYVRAHDLKIVARMHPPGWAYVRMTDRFDLPALRYEDWVKDQSRSE